MSPDNIKLFTDHLEAHRMAIAIGGFFAMAGGLLQFGEALRLGYRHKTHAIPFYVLLFYFANDMTYVALYSRWFHDVGHPMIINSWYWFLPYPVLELAVGWQIVNYSRHEVFPGASKAQAYMAYAAAQALMGAFFWWLVTALDDYFLTLTGMLTIVGSNMNIYLLTRRRDRKGQSLLYAWTMVLAAGPINWFVLFPAMDARMATPAFQALGTAVCLLGFAYVYFLWRAPAFGAATTRTEKSPA